MKDNHMIFDYELNKLSRVSFGRRVKMNQMMNKPVLDPDTGEPIMEDAWEGIPDVTAKCLDMLQTRIEAIEAELAKNPASEMADHLAKKALTAIRKPRIIPGQKKKARESKESKEAENG